MTEFDELKKQLAVAQAEVKRLEDKQKDLERWGPGVNPNDFHEGIFVVGYQGIYDKAPHEQWVLFKHASVNPETCPCIPDRVGLGFANLNCTAFKNYRRLSQTQCEKVRQFIVELVDKGGY